MKYKILLTFVFLIAMQNNSNASGRKYELPESEIMAETNAVTDDVLEDSRGASGFNPALINLSQLTAQNTGNTIVNPVSGYNMIGDNAFEGSNGLISVIQNSGNGVIIQNSTVVNLSMQ